MNTKLRPKPTHGQLLHWSVGQTTTDADQELFSPESPREVPQMLSQQQRNAGYQRKNQGAFAGILAREFPKVRIGPRELLSSAISLRTSRRWPPRFQRCQSATPATTGSYPALQERDQMPALAAWHTNKRLNVFFGFRFNHPIGDTQNETTNHPPLFLFPPHVHLRLLMPRVSRHRLSCGSGISLLNRRSCTRSRPTRTTCRNRTRPHR